VFSAVFVFGCFAVTAWADPVVVRNGSAIEGDGSVYSLGSTVASDYYALYGDAFFPTSGTGTASDTLTLRSAGATLTPSSHLTTSISGGQFAARGGAIASAAVDSSFNPSAFFDVRASSTLVIEFTLATWHAFTYVGQYAGAGEGFDSSFENFRSTYGTLYRVIPLGENTTGTFSYFRDEFDSHQVTEHSGLLEPGRYFLQARSGVLVRRPDTTGSLAFDVALNLSPAPAPIPEPATIVLLGAGLAGAIVRSRRLT
jgi:hypothetical protein